MTRGAGGSAALPLAARGLRLRRTVLPRRLAVARAAAARSGFALLVGVLFAAAMAGCAGEPSDRERLAQARVLEAEGRFEEARALYAEVATSAPDDPEVHLRFAAFLVARGELDEAGAVLESAAGAPMTASQVERYDAERDRYWRAVLEDSRGSDHTPRDRRRYELALLGLIEIHEGGDALTEYHAWLLARARRALGHPSDVALGGAPLTESVERATPGQAAEALDALDRLLEGDPTWSSVYPIPESIATEADAIRESLRRRLFRDRFLREWTRRHEARLVDEGRFDASSEQVLLRFRGPPPHPSDPEESASRHAFIAQTYGARELLTDFAYELAGRARGGADPLPFTMVEFASVRVDEARFRDEAFVMRVRVPFSLVERAGYLLERRQQSS